MFVDIDRFVVENRLHYGYTDCLKYASGRRMNVISGHFLISIRVVRISLCLWNVDGFINYRFLYIYI